MWLRPGHLWSRRGAQHGGELSRKWTTFPSPTCKLEEAEERLLAGKTHSAAQANTSLAQGPFRLEPRTRYKWAPLRIQLCLQTPLKTPGMRSVAISLAQSFLPRATRHACPPLAPTSHLLCAETSDPRLALEFGSLWLPAPSFGNYFVQC